jgi:hypothetical protein
MDPKEDNTSYPTNFLTIGREENQRQYEKLDYAHSGDKREDEHYLKIFDRINDYGAYFRNNRTRVSQNLGKNLVIKKLLTRINLNFLANLSSKMIQKAYIEPKRFNASDYTHLLNQKRSKKCHSH